MNTKKTWYFINGLALPLILANYPGIQAILVTLDGEIIKLNF